MLVVSCLPELLKEVSADDTVETEPHGKCEIVVKLRLLRRALDCNLLDACPTARVLLHNRFLQLCPLARGLRFQAFTQKHFGMAVEPSEAIIRTAHRTAEMGHVLKPSKIRFRSIL